MSTPTLQKQFLSALKNTSSKVISDPKMQSNGTVPLPLIRLRDVNTVYEGERFPTLQDISLAINPGDFVFVTGPNGSGKTTLLETILGLLPISNGSVEIENLSIFNHKISQRKNMGYVIQGLEFDPQTTFLVKDVVMVGRTGKLGLLHSPKQLDWAIVKECLKAVGMESYWKHPIGKLSGGQQQKVLIASALASEPRILLLDEPFSNLDIIARQEIFALFDRLNRLANITIICVSHSSGIPDHVHRVLLLQSGRIVLDGKREDVIGSPLYKAYLEFFNDADEEMF